MNRLSPPAVWMPLGALVLLFIAMLLVGGPGSELDRGILIAAQHAELVPAARMLTTVGGWAVVIPITLLGAAWLLYRRHRRQALLLCGLLLSERALVEAFKELFDRARPDPHGHLVVVNSMAFPSGHAANAMTLGLGFALLVVPAARRTSAVLAALVFAAAIGLSRPILGVHWPSDVIGGWALGAAWTLLLVRLFAADPRQGTSAVRPH
ncbi:phosphatase PAP2 family protein [Allosphingosinicella deserti]|nr:phosphatase PAP2 family protein [Sphingomonas deserti]